MTIAGRPSGIADTARETAVMKISSTSMPFIRPTTKIIVQAARATMPRYLPSWASFCCKGVWVSLSPSSRPAILPISVCIPVPVTTAVAVPYVTLHPENTILLRSPTPAFSSTTASASFSDGTDSPVKADSSLLRLTLFSSRASAGIKSPASRWIMSPGTSWEASMIFSSPSRRTLARGADIFFRASRAFSALLSCTIPIMALSTTMSRISTGSKNSIGSPSTQAMTKETAAARSRIMIMTSLNCSKNRWRLVFFFFSCNLFSPYWERRWAAWPLVSPFSGEVCRLFRRASFFS